VIDVVIYGVQGELRQTLRSFSKWLGTRLLGERLAPNVSVTVIVSKFEGEDKGFHGFVEYQGNNVRPREFIIRMNKNMDRELMIETLAHEMVHVKQDVRGEKQERYKGGYKLLWKGKDHTKTPYSKQPWEREAYRLEKKLVKEYFGE
jgi:hypothetical protein